MAVSSIVAPSTSNIKQTFTVTAANTLYSSSVSLAAGTYTVTGPSSGTHYVDFYNGTTFIVSAATVSGTVDINLASSANTVKYYSATAGAVIGVLLTGSPVTGATSGTLDTITATTNTYAGTGTAYAVIVGGGGGGGGGSGANSSQNGGSGGGSGGILAIGPVTLTGSMNITIGAAGNGGASGGNGAGVTGGSGGATTFAGYTVNGGSGGIGPGNRNVDTAGGAGGTVGGVAGGLGARSTFYSSPGTATTQTNMGFVKIGTNGSGGGGSSTYAYAAPGGGSGIGTGGNGGDGQQNTTYNGGAATGYGAGGGGGGTTANTTYVGAGGAGSPGVVYIVRFNS